MKILFICKFNRFRSKVAETIFNSLNKNNQNQAESAGILTPKHGVAENVVKIIKQKGYSIKNKKPRQITEELTKNFDKIIITADNVSPEFFSKFNKEIIQWQISDCSEKDIIKIKERINQIEEKVKQLIKTNS